MELRASNNRNAALTFTEVLVVLAVLIVLAAVYLAGAPDPNAKDRAQSMNCVNNLKEIGLAYKIWEGDHNDRFPFSVSATNGGTMELAQNGDVVSTFQTMSNQLATPKILHCTADSDNDYAANFSPDFSAKNISYFVGVDADENNPSSILAGDDNFEIGGTPIKSGLVTVMKNADIGWTSARHKFDKTKWTLSRQKNIGNIAFADGSAFQMISSSLATNFSNGSTRLAIP
ncbi:MAG TPA: hypothetical protein VGI03_09595 [Verrucomicrobiae bacterium]|jgi:hypothetical protein